MTVLNDLYLVIWGLNIAIIAICWALEEQKQTWDWGNSLALGANVVCLAVSLLPGFSWACRGVLTASLLMTTAELGRMHHWWRVPR